MRKATPAKLIECRPSPDDHLAGQLEYFLTELAMDLSGVKATLRLIVDSGNDVDAERFDGDHQTIVDALNHTINVVSRLESMVNGDMDTLCMKIKGVVQRAPRSTTVAP